MPRRTIAFGVFWILVTCVGWFHTGRSVLMEIALSRHGQTVPGFIVDAEEFEDSDDRGTPMWSTGLQYAYRLPDGRRLTSACNLNGRLDTWLDNLNPLEVEYLPEKPEVSRIRGTDRTNIAELVLLAILYALPGFYGILMVRGPHGRKERAT